MRQLLVTMAVLLLASGLPVLAQTVPDSFPPDEPQATEYRNGQYGNWRPERGWDGEREYGGYYRGRWHCRPPHFLPPGWRWMLRWRWVWWGHGPHGRWVWIPEWRYERMPGRHGVRPGCGRGPRHR